MKRTSDCCSTFFPSLSLLATCASIVLYYPFSSPIYLNYFISLPPAFFYLPLHLLLVIFLTAIPTSLSSFSILILFPHYFHFFSTSFSTFSSLSFSLPSPPSFTQSPPLSSSKPPFPSSFAPWQSWCSEQRTSCLPERSNRPRRRTHKESFHGVWNR